MPRKPQPEVEPQLRRRAELAIQLANEWMAAMNASQRGLASLLDVDQSVLSRFLSQQPGYEPAKNRPRILKLLEDIEQVCVRLEDVVPISGDLSFDPEDDLKRWTCTLAFRLQHLRHYEDPGGALTRFPDLSIQALHVPGPSRVNVCNTASLTAAILMAAEWRSRVCTSELISQTLGRVDALQAAVFETLDATGLDEVVESRHRARSRSYCGTARSYAGLRRQDQNLLKAGFEEQLQACSAEGLQPKDRVWHNLLTLLNILLKKEWPEAALLAHRATEVVRQHPSESLDIALADRDLTSLTSFWGDHAPDLLEGWQA